MGKDDNDQYTKKSRRQVRDAYHQDRDPSNSIFQELDRDIKADRQKDFDYRNSHAQQLHQKGSWQHPAKTSILKERGPSLPKKLEWLNTSHLTPTQQSKITLDRLMANPGQQIMMRTQGHANKDSKLWTPHVFRNEGGNQMSSTAGAGCNKFHEFRQIRRNDRDREKFFEKLRVKEKETAIHDKKVAEFKAAAAAKLSKNQLKRKRMKNNMKLKKEIQAEELAAEQKRLKKLSSKGGSVGEGENGNGNVVESSEDEDFDDIDEESAAALPPPVEKKVEINESSEVEDFDDMDEPEKNLEKNLEKSVEKDSSSDEDFDNEDASPSMKRKIDDDDDFALDDESDDDDLPVAPKIAKHHVDEEMEDEVEDVKKIQFECPEMAKLFNKVKNQEAEPIEIAHRGMKTVKDVEKPLEARVEVSVEAQVEAHVEAPVQTSVEVEVGDQVEAFPVIEESVETAPVVESPVAEVAVAEVPVVEAPVEKSPVRQISVKPSLVEEALVKKPITPAETAPVEQPKPVIQPTLKIEPKIEQPKIDQPKIDQPKPQEPVVHDKKQVKSIENVVEPVERQTHEEPSADTSVDSIDPADTSMEKTAEPTENDDDVVLIALTWTELVKYGRITKKGAEIFDDAGKTPTDYYNMEPIELTKFMTDLSVNKRTMQAILKKRQAWWDWAMGLVK